MKTAIIAAIKGYNIEIVRPWIESLNATGYSGKIGIVLYDENEELASYLVSKGANVFITQLEQITNIATQRFRDYYHLLQTPNFSDVEWIIHTDIRDVIFQSNPENYLQNINRPIVATGEGVTYRNEDWNGEGLQYCYGNNVYNSMADVETLCSGIIAGKKHEISDLFKTIYELAFYTPEPNAFADQHYYNLAIRKIYDEITECVPADQPWVANLGTLIALPMLNPNWSTGPRTPNRSYERFRKGTYIENMLVKLPQMIDGKVCTPTGVPYTIVHQYDRYKPWADILLKREESKENVATIVTALYDLNRENWQGFQRPFQQYKDWMKSMLSFDAPMVIFVEPKDVDFVTTERSDKLHKTEIIPIPFAELYVNQKWGDGIRKVMALDKFLANQTVPTHPQIAHPEYNILMHQKIQFVKQAILTNKFNTEHFMWLDAGVFHMNNRTDLIGKKYPYSNIFNDKVNLICIEEPKQSDADDLEKFYKGHNVRVIGTSWGGHNQAILEFEKTYTGLLEESISNGLMDQDQSFLTVSYLRNPTVCKLYRGNWQSALNNWG